MKIVSENRFSGKIFFYTITSRAHQFQQLVVHAHELKTLMTPVYGGGRSGYVPETSKAQTEMPINAPVYKGGMDKNQYNPQVSAFRGVTNCCHL